MIFNCPTHCSHNPISMNCLSISFLVRSGRNLRKGNAASLPLIACHSPSGLWELSKQNETMRQLDTVWTVVVYIVHCCGYQQHFLFVSSHVSIFVAHFCLLSRGKAMFSLFWSTSVLVHVTFPACWCVDENFHMAEDVIWELANLIKRDSERNATVFFALKNVIKKRGWHLCLLDPSHASIPSILSQSRRMSLSQSATLRGTMLRVCAKRPFWFASPHLIIYAFDWIEWELRVSEQTKLKTRAWIGIDLQQEIKLPLFIVRY